MIINKNYLIQRADILIKQKQKSLDAYTVNDDKLYRVKMLFPKWLRNIVFHPFNPVYSVFVQYKALKRKEKNHINLRKLYPFAVDFFEYCFTHDICFDTSVYFPKEDECQIEAFIDNRLKSVLAGYDRIELIKEQIDMFAQKKELQKKVRKISNGYELALNGISYCLPQNIFEEHTYIHDYGLIYLPDYIKEYIKGKDFLDIGAYLGDTSVLLLKKYSPNHVYAYEPMEDNVGQIEKTIQLNEAGEQMSVINKGIGDKDSVLDIYIDPHKMSACSINESISSDKSIKKQVQITTIDSECKDKKTGLIKMDIEGAEYSAIVGGLETIRRDQPVILISAYHTGKDFFEILPILKGAVPSYLFRFIDLEITSPITEKIIIAYPSLN